MKQKVFLVAATTIGLVALGNGCDVNPFSPPEEAKPGAESSSSSSGSTTSSSSSSSGSSSSSASSGSGGGMAGAGGTGGGGGGTAGSGGGCVCTDDNNVCTDDLSGKCPGDDPAACHSINFAAQCPAGRCDDKGECVACLACADAACVDRCNGISCAAPGECKNGQCEQATCCNEACAGPCRACNRSGVEGTCTRLPNGAQPAGCDGGKLCGNDGTCITKTKAPLGALCTTSADCQSGVCRREYCQSTVGEPCVDNVECDTNLCDPTTKTCKSCAGPNAGVCPAGAMCMMPEGRCQVFLGQPAGSSAECAQGTLVQFLCSLGMGEACTGHHECVSRNCSNGVCTPQCSNPGQCLEGGPCSGNGVCGMLAGNYCMITEHCKSGVCTGFPRKCQ